MKNFGVAINMQVRTLENGKCFSGYQVVKLHEKVLENSQSVYFSTNFQTDKKRAPFIDEIILFNYKEGFAFRAKCDEVLCSKSEFLPSDAEMFSPKEFVFQEKRTWFRISSFTEVSMEELENVFLESEPEVSIAEKKKKSDGRPSKLYYIM